MASDDERPTVTLRARPEDDRFAPSSRLRLFDDVEDEDDENEDEDCVADVDAATAADATTETDGAEDEDIVRRRTRENANLIQRLRLWRRRTWFFRASFLGHVSKGRMSFPSLPVLAQSSGSGLPAKSTRGTVVVLCLVFFETLIARSR